ncbi:MAG: hypothetical protein II797_04165 [Clostridia bacterium]|nr:hypothetical protein [Clostridia bacterium]
MNPTQKKSRTIFNIFLLLVSAILAFFVWTVSAQSSYTTYEQTFNSVPVTLLNTALLKEESGLSVISGDNSAISVTVIGKKDDVTALTLSDITATADVGTIKNNGIYALNVSINIKDSSRTGISVKSMSSTSITVYVDSMSTVTVPIQTQVIKASHPSNYVIETPIPSVSEITVTGPKSTISSISHAMATVDFENQIVTTPMTSICPITLISTSGSVVSNPHIQLEFSEIEVSVPVYVQMTLPLTVNFRYGYLTSTDYEMTLSRESVSVLALPEVSELYSSILLATIDETSLTENEYEYRYQINLPYGMTLVNPEENSVTVNLKLDSDLIAAQTRFTIYSFDVLNAPTNDYSILTKSLIILIRPLAGNFSRLGFMTSSDVTVRADFSALVPGEGETEVPCTIILRSPFDSIAYVVGTYTISVRI